MKWKNLIFTAAICVLPFSGSGFTAEIGETNYAQKIGGIFRLHLKSIEELVTKESRYSDNVVRHAMALADAAGLLDHIVEVESERGVNENWPWKDAEEYEKLYKANAKAIRKLAKTAGTWLDGGEKAPLVTAIEELKVTCRNCHRDRSNFP